MRMFAISDAMDRQPATYARPPRGGVFSLAAILLAGASFLLTHCGPPLFDGHSNLVVAVANGGTNINGDGNTPNLTDSPNCTVLGAAIEVPAGFDGGGQWATLDAQYDPLDTPWVVWTTVRGLTGTAVHVETLQNGQWKSVGASATDQGIKDTGTSGAQWIVLQFGSWSRPYVGWASTPTVGTGSPLNMMQWDGNTWADFNRPGLPEFAMGGFNFDVGPGSEAALAMYNKSDDTMQLYQNVDLLGDTNWVKLAAISDFSKVVVAQGGSAMAWSSSGSVKFAAVVNGNFVPTASASGSFDHVSDDANGVTAISVAAFASQSTLVVWDANRRGISNVYARFSDQFAKSWVELGESDTAYGVSGISQAPGARHPSMVLDANGYPTIAYEDLTTNQVAIRVWDGVRWSDAVTLSRATNAAAWPRLASTSDGRMMVAWEQDNARIFACQIR